MTSHHILSFPQWSRLFTSHCFYKSRVAGKVHCVALQWTELRRSRCYLELFYGRLQPLHCRIDSLIKSLAVTLWKILSSQLSEIWMQCLLSSLLWLFSIFSLVLWVSEQMIAILTALGRHTCTIPVEVFLPTRRTRVWNCGQAWYSVQYADPKHYLDWRWLNLLPFLAKCELTRQLIVDGMAIGRHVTAQDAFFSQGCCLLSLCYIPVWMFASSFLSVQV